MRCVYCEEKAGFLKRTCPDCIRLVAVVDRLPAAFGFRQLLDALIETGIPTRKIEAFLNKDVDGSGSVREYVTARMTNEVMASLGQPSHLKPEDVKRVERLMAEGKAPSQTDGDVVDYSQLFPKKKES